MIWRFAVVACLFTAGDMLSFTSMLHLDPGTFSLVGKAFSIVATVLLTRIILYKKHTKVQYGLVAAVAVSTYFFCRAESSVRSTLAVNSKAPASNLAYGIALRIGAVLLASMAAVLQERFLALESGVPFLMQQCWMACGALCTSLLALRVMHGLPPSQLLTGFDDWRACTLLAFQVVNGLCAGLMVKKLGALTKSLCVPINLGGCYMYAVIMGSAVLGIRAVAAWAMSTAFIVAFLISKARATSKADVLPRVALARAVS